MRLTEGQSLSLSTAHRSGSYLSTSFCRCGLSLSRFDVGSGSAHHLRDALVAGGGCFCAQYPKEVLVLLAVSEVIEIGLSFTIGGI